MAPPDDDAAWWAWLHAWRTECNEILTRLRAILDAAGV